MSTRISPLAFFGERNALLGRELKTALRSERAFLLMAIYIAFLGAIVTARFPAERAFSVDTLRSSGAPGSGLFYLFCGAQALLVMVLLPALAAGALAQERENRSLESLLLTPLSTFQIVIGKAAGVLAFALLLLAASLPLSALCFLLGGVSPSEFIGAYTVLFALAGCVTALGLYCSSRYADSTRATLVCYGWLLIGVPMVALFAGAGAIVSGILLIGWPMWGAISWWGKSQHSEFARRHRFLHALILPVALLFGLYFLVRVLVAVTALGFFWILFVAPYFALIAWAGMRAAAAELSRAPETRVPKPLEAAARREEWQRAFQTPPVAAPMPTGRYSYTPQTGATMPASTRTSRTAASQAQTAVTHAAASQVAQAQNAAALSATYRESAFLPDGVNPVFARERRGGLLGKVASLQRGVYAFFIVSEVLLGLWLLFNPNASTRAVGLTFARYAGYHLMVTMVLAAVFGARTIAPEREQGTLLQLLTTPLSAWQILGGKAAAVLLFSFYIVLGAALPAALLAITGLIAPGAFGVFLISEIVYGGAAAALGVWCSQRAPTVRRALGAALGAVVAIFMANLLLSGALFDALREPSIEAPLRSALLMAAAFLSPSVFYEALGAFTGGTLGAVSLAPDLALSLWRLSMLIFALLGALLMALTILDFRHRAKTL